MKRVVIWSPDYDRKSGGIRALHLLCHYLNKFGQPAVITSLYRNPELLTHRFTGELQPGDVVVYPEIVRGNPLNAPAGTVFRFILARRVQDEWGKDDRFIVFSKSFLGYARKALGADLGVEHVLRLPIIETTIFNHDNLPQDRTFVLSYKCNFPDAVEITDTWPGSWEEMAALFKEGRFLVTGDNCTAVMDEALMCGCPVLMMGEWKPEFYDHLDYDIKGAIATKLSEIEGARHAAERSYYNYISYISREFPRQLERFIVRVNE